MRSTRTNAPRGGNRELRPATGPVRSQIAPVSPNDAATNRRCRPRPKWVPTASAKSGSEESHPRLTAANTIGCKAAAESNRGDTRASEQATPAATHRYGAGAQQPSRPPTRAKGQMYNGRPVPRRLGVTCAMNPRRPAAHASPRPAKQDESALGRRRARSNRSRPSEARAKPADYDCHRPVLFGPTGIEVVCRWQCRAEGLLERGLAVG